MTRKKIKRLQVSLFVLPIKYRYHQWSEGIDRCRWMRAARSSQSVTIVSQSVTIVRAFPFSQFHIKGLFDLFPFVFLVFWSHGTHFWCQSSLTSFKLFNSKFIFCQQKTAERMVSTAKLSRSGFRPSSQWEDYPPWYNSVISSKIGKMIVLS